jgi:sulfur carrier protein
MPDPPTLAILLLAFEPQRPYAVARNDEFVPRSTYHQCELIDGDRIEIVRPSAGG